VRYSRVSLNQQRITVLRCVFAQNHGLAKSCGTVNDVYFTIQMRKTNDFKPFTGRDGRNITRCDAPGFFFLVSRAMKLRASSSMLRTSPG
jgi:hypothetical protein